MANQLPADARVSYHETLRSVIRTVLISLAAVTASITCVWAVCNWSEQIGAERVRQLELNETLNERTRATIVNEIEALRKQLGRVPKNQSELQSLLGIPLPPIVGSYGNSEIYYTATSSDGFCLNYRNPDSFRSWSYDSNRPNVTWVHEAED